MERKQRKGLSNESSMTRWLNSNIHFPGGRNQLLGPQAHTWVHQAQEEGQDPESGAHTSASEAPVVSCSLCSHLSLNWPYAWAGKVAEETGQDPGLCKALIIFPWAWERAGFLSNCLSPFLDLPRLCWCISSVPFLDPSRVLCLYPI